MNPNPNPNTNGGFYSTVLRLKKSIHPCEYNMLHFSPASPSCPF